MNKLKTLLVAASLIFAAGCTPEQIKSIEEHYSIDISPEAEAWAVAQPDQPVVMMDGTRFETNGEVTLSAGLAGAIAQAQYGVCDSWLPVYNWFAASVKRPPTWAWFKKVLQRESGCGWDTYNEATGDSGPIQINPVHRKWIKAELGYDFIQIRQWQPGIEAAIALWNKTGKCNWVPPNFCA